MFFGGNAVLEKQGLKINYINLLKKYTHLMYFSKVGVFFRLGVQIIILL